MESDAETGVTRNDLLSHSYVECVSRVAQQKSDGGLGFVLPKEVLEEREMVWNQFFHKYNQEVPDEVELNLDTMKPITAAADGEAEEAEDDEEEDDDEEDDEDDEDEEDKKYDSKCRAPLRKLPALIQYWIDTGNPPYRLVGDDDDTETGSSLTEGEHSKSGHSDVVRENGEKQKSNTSRCSSVDTAAYILSNTNVTKKAEAMAIVEGAKSSGDRFAGKVSPLKDISVESSCKAVALSPNSGQRSHLNDFIVSNNESPKDSATSQQSVKLSEILPELQEFDEMLEKSKELSTPRTSSSLNQIRETPKDVRPANAIAVVEPNEQGFFPVRKKLQNRRKLYTGRDSPVDLVVERPIGQAMAIVRRSLHPALGPLNPGDDKSAPAARVRRKRKRKRASHISEINSQDGNTSQQSDQPVDNEHSKSDSRYADFFESLGLTPSRGIVGKPRVGRPAAKRLKTTDRRVLPRNAKNVAPTNESLESSMKESGDNSQTEDSVPSPVAKDQNSNAKPAETILCGEKILRVRIERLSDECLARYSRKMPAHPKPKELEEKESPITTSTSSGKSSGKKMRRLNHEKIEVLTTATHDSDSSTILICACNETDNARKSDSDAPMVGEKNSRTKKMSLRLRRQKSSAKAATAETAVKLPEPFVQLEKLKIDDVQKTDSGNATIKFKTSINPTSPDENGNKSDLFGSNASKSVTNGNRIFGASNGCELKEKLRHKLRSTRSRCILMPSDDEEDSFVKLISEIGSKRSSTNVKEQQNNNSTGKTGSEKSLSRLAISTSSDEEDVEDRKLQRRTRNSRNQRKRRESRKTNDDLVQETDKKTDAVRKLDNKAEAVKKLENKTDAVKTLDESNRRKLRSEKTAKDIEATETGKRTTRGSKTTQTSARKMMKDSLPVSKDKVEMDVEDGETRANNNEVGRSTRQNSSTSGSPKNPPSTKTPSRLKSPSKNLFATDKSDAPEIPAWVDRDLNPEDSSAKNALKNAGRPEEPESLSPFRPGHDVKKIVKVSHSSRFQTRLDFDSDSEFEGLRFSLRGKNTKRIPEKEINGVQNANIAETEILRTSPRRSSDKLLSRMREISEKKVKTRRGNLFEDGSEPPENPLESEMDVVTPFKNGVVSLKVLPTNGTKNSPEKERKNRGRKVESVGRRSRKDSTKSTERSKNQSPTAKQRNEGPKVSSLAKKNKPRRTRIVGNSMEWESEDDTDSNENKINNTKQGKTIQPLANGDGTKQSKYDRSTKNLFSPSPNVAEDVDLLFDVGAKTRGSKNAVVIPKLNFASTKKQEKLDGLGSFAMSFRTRLRSDTEDDENS